MPETLSQGVSARRPQAQQFVGIIVGIVRGVDTGGSEMALTDLKVRNIKPTGKVIKISDGEGLYLQVQPNGSKLWRMAYRFLGKQRTLAIGTYPEISLQEARERKMEARKLLAQGIDPSQEKQEKVRASKVSAETTFSVVAKEYMNSLEKRGRAKNTLDQKTWVLKAYVLPKIGKRPIAEITAADVLDLLTDIEATGKLETARRARQAMSAVFRLATITKRANGDPTHVLQRVISAPKVTSHPAIVSEMGFGELLRKIDTYRSPIVRLALNFLALTWPRPIELRKMTWDQVDYEESVWTIPAEHTKLRRPHDIPLSHAARVILRDVRRITGLTEGYVFPSPKSRGFKEMMSENCINKALWSLGYKGKHCGHGFRSSASTILNERKYDKDVIEFQLAHIEENETRRAYNRALYWDYRVKMMNDWAKIVEKLREGVASSNDWHTGTPTLD